MVDYRPRVADAELAERLVYLGAVLIDGPKAAGKTATASQVAKTVYRMDVDHGARTALETYPDQLFSAPPPVLFDEWQGVPEIWNLVRRAVDDHSEKGLYLLTGSSRPRDVARLHSGAGRIGRLRLRPMSLFESGHSTGSVSLAAILDGAEPVGHSAMLTVPDLVERIVVGGWPEVINYEERLARSWLTDYLNNIAEVDVPALGPRRNPGNIARFLAALGRATGTPLRQSTIAMDVGRQHEPVDPKTLRNYFDALDRLMLTEPLPAWRPHLRSRTRLRATPVHHFVDPSIGVAALGVGSTELLADMEATGFQFESLAMRDLRVYGQPLGARWSSWRDTGANKEVDAILELPNGRWAAIEIKLGETQTDVAAKALLHLTNKIDPEKHGKPAALIVITGGRFTYRRPDGVVVVPITALGP